MSLNKQQWALRSVVSALVIVSHLTHAANGETLRPLSPEDLASMAENPVIVSRFNFLVNEVMDGSKADRFEFARAAIAALITAHEQEVDLAYAIAVDVPGNTASLRSWARGTAAYIEQLKAHERNLLRGAAVSIVKDVGGDLRLIIGRASVSVSPPRVNEQLALEQEIAMLLCRYYHCETQPETLEDRVNRKTAELTQEWEFSDRKPPQFRSSDGLNCVYSDATHLKLKKQVCESALHELRLVAETLTAVRQRGGRIDYGRLKLRTERGQQVLEYAGRYRSFNLRLPVLAQAPDVLTLARQWLRAHVEGRVVPHYVTLPDEVIYVSGQRMFR